MIDTPGFGEASEIANKHIENIVAFLKPDDVKDKSKVRWVTVSINVYYDYIFHYIYFTKHPTCLMYINYFLPADGFTLS